MYKRKLILIILLGVTLFLPSINIFFISDDWFHLRISQIGNIEEFINFFSFSQTPQSAAFYRPIPTQVFFFVFNSLFGLNAVPYHIFTLFVFGLSLYLLSKLLLKLFDRKLALISTFIYAISVTHFSRLYFLSAFQEIAMAVFLISAMLFYIDHSKKGYLGSLILYILSLASKETAVVLPALLLLIDWEKGVLKIRKIMPFILITAAYLIFYLNGFGFKTEGSYAWDFSPLKAVNTLFWYTVWSFGGPEFLVDYVGSGLKIVPRFFEQFREWSVVILSFIGFTFLSFFSIILKNKNIFKKEFLFGVFFFLVAILPVLFLPLHKFTLELTLPLIGFCIAVASLLNGSSKATGYIFISAFVIMNIASYLITYQTHFAVARSKISNNIYQYFLTNYPNYPRYKYFEFVNEIESSKQWGVSKQIAQVTSYSDMFKVIYRNKGVKVYFEDLPETKPGNLEQIRLSSMMFLR